MDAKRLIAALREADYSPRKYSGRGMCGRSCVAFEIDGGAGSAFLAGAVVASYLGDDGCSELSDLPVSSDGMGRGTVVYFPGTEWPECGSEVEDGELEEEDVA